MNARDTMALIGYAEMLDDTVDLRDDSRGMNGGDPIRTLMNEVQRLEVEIARLKIAHLRRMADSCDVVKERAIEFAYPCPAEGWTDKRYWDIIRRVDRFRSACLAKITELKESQCSTKS